MVNTKKTALHTLAFWFSKNDLVDTHAFELIRYAST